MMMKVEKHVTKVFMPFCWVELSCQKARANWMVPPTRSMMKPKTLVLILFIETSLLGFSRFYQMMSSGSQARVTATFAPLTTKVFGSPPQLQTYSFSSLQSEVW
jgi:TctA family transporter